MSRISPVQFDSIQVKPEQVAFYPATMRLLVDDYDIEAGESAVAGLAALITACNDTEVYEKLVKG